jgi:hypothetical protein
MHAWRASLGPANMQAPCRQFDLMPMQVAQLRYRPAFRAVAISLSISAGVKYSRVRATEEFTMVGDALLVALEAMIIRY